jgi:hypothetical protein
MGANFKHSFLLLAAGGAPAAAASSAAASRPPWVLDLGRAAEPADVVRAQLALVRALASTTAAAAAAAQPAAPALPSAAALLCAVCALPGVCGDAAAAAALLRGSGALADMACATAPELAQVGRLRCERRAAALADALQQPCALVLPRAATLTL